MKFLTSSVVTFLLASQALAQTIETAPATGSINGGTVSGEAPIGGATAPGTATAGTGTGAGAAGSATTGTGAEAPGTATAGTGTGAGASGSATTGTDAGAAGSPTTGEAAGAAGDDAAGTVADPAATGAATGNSTAGAGEDHMVMVGAGGLKYDPETIEIALGDTVTWMWEGGPHDVVEADTADSCEPTAGGIASEKLSTGSWSQTFDTPGKFWYICSVGTHCTAGMKGLVNVLAEGETPSGNTGNSTADAGSSAVALSRGNMYSLVGALLGVVALF